MSKISRTLGVVLTATISLAACRNREAPAPVATEPVAGAPTAGSAAAATVPAGSAAPTAPTRTPCSLLSKAEAEAILGEPVRDPSAQSGGCAYFLVTPHRDTLASIPWVSVTWTQGTRANFDSAVHAYERAGAATPVPGVGDHAMTVEGFLFVLAGEHIISIQPGNTAIPAATIRAFAEKALTHI
jgi:hypothetical protein